MKRLILVVCLLLLVACSNGAGPTATTTAPPTAMAGTGAPTAQGAAAATPAAASTTTGASTVATGTTAGATTTAAGATTTASTATGAAPITGAATPTRASGTPSAVARATGTASPVRRANSTPGAANIAPGVGANLVVQAVDTLLDRYVDPLNTADLYGAAYDAAVATLRASGKTPQVARPTFTGDPGQDEALFRQAYLALAEPARGDIDQATLAYETIEGIVRAVDECHTAFLTPEQAEQQRNALQGTANYVGIGVTIQPTAQPLTVGEVYPGTPAERGGLQSGDAFLAVNGTDVTNLNADQVRTLVIGPEGTDVTLTIQRPGEAQPRQVTLTRARIQIPVFRSEIKTGPNGEKIGYMKLYQFAQGTERQVQQALEEFERQGVTGWVLDLRGNPGGFVNTFAQIASRFVEGRQTVGYQVSRDGTRDPIVTNGQSYFTPQQPLAVLINGGSASASEAFAAAAQDYGFARLFGQKTAGCLAVASYFPLDDGSALEVTIEKFLSPKDREINRVGVEPDVPIAPRPGGNGDPVLDAALDWLAAQP